MGINVQDVLSQDPEFLRKQLALKELQTVNPTNDPFATIGYTLGRGFGNVSQGRGFFDVADPALQRAAKVRAIQSQVAQSGETDPNKLATLFADELAKDPELAPFSLQVRSQIKPTESIFGKIDPSKFTPESLATFEKSRRVSDLVPLEREKEQTPQNKAERDYLTSLQAKYPDTVEGRAQAANDFATWKSSFRQKEAEAGVPKPTLQEKALMPGTAETRADILKRALNAQNTVFIADSMDRVLSNAFVGAGATAKLTLGQIATALGVEVKGVSETEQLNSLLAALTQGQARNLPGALSDKDVLFLKEAIGKGSFTIDTLRSVTKQIKTEALAAEIENDRIQQIINTGGDLNKFDFVKNKKSAMAEARTQIEERNAKLEELRKLRQKRGF